MGGDCEKEVILESELSMVNCDGFGNEERFTQSRGDAGGGVIIGGGRNFLCVVLFNGLARLLNINFGRLVAEDGIV